MSKITNNILQLVTSVSLLLLVYSTYVIRVIPSEGYVINIYKQLPFHFYLTLLFCYLSACALLLAYRKISAVLILLLVHIIVLIIPYILGYVSPSRGDEYIYIELVGKSELIGFSNLSPTGPLFISALALITGLEKWVLSYFLPVFFFNYLYHRNVPFLSNIHEPRKIDLSSFSFIDYSLFWAFPGFNICLLPVFLPCASLSLFAEECTFW